MPLSHDDLIQMYRWMVLTRTFEQKVLDLYHQKGVPELPHSSVGQEAIGVGACYGLRREDVIVPSLRTRAAFMVKGVPPGILMAAMFGKDTPQCRGKSTSHHMGDLDIGLIAGSGVVAASIPVAVGAALGCKLKKTDAVTLAFFGDGATNTGNFHESVNLAAMLGLPVVFVCENNQYGMSMSVRRAVRAENIAARAVSYGITGDVVDGNDVVAVYNAVQEAIQRAKGKSPKPTLLDCQTYRWYGHCEKDPPDLIYRSSKEVEAWKRKCPIQRLRKDLLDRSILKENDLARIDGETRKEVDEAVKFADEAPYPDPETVLDDVYAPLSEEVVL